MSIAHDHRYRYLDEHRDGFDLFYCEVCLEYRAVKRDDQPAVREIDAASAASTPRDVLSRIMLGQHPDEDQSDKPE
jgi:hypothetical protein